MMICEMEFEKFKTMQFPRDVYVGHGVLPNIVPVVGRYMRAGSILVVTGNITYNLAGREIEALLTDSGYSVHVIKADKADISNLKNIEEEARDLSIGLIVGVGGGTKIDLAKKSAFDMGVPFVSVPTSPCSLLASFQSRRAVRFDITSAAPALRYLNGALDRIYVSAMMAIGMEAS